jgi:outer membrane immunogenic protein
MRKSVVIGAAFAVLLVTRPAAAADLRPPVYTAAPQIVAAPSWTGFYIGVNTGYIRDHVNASGQALPMPANGGTTVLSSQSFEPSGWLGGGQLGYNYQWQYLVLGVEADIQASEVDGDSSTYFTKVLPAPGCSATNAPPCNGALGFGSNLRAFGTLRGRVGYAFGHALFYATGGLIVGYLNERVNWDFTAPTPPVAYLASWNRTAVGGVWGAGVEYEFAHPVSLKIEALGYHLGSDSTVVNPSAVVPPPQGTPSPGSFTQQTIGWLVRVGLNYRFGSAYAPAIIK